MERDAVERLLQRSGRYAVLHPFLCHLTNAAIEYKAGRLLQNPGKYIDWLPRAMPSVRAAYSGMSDEQRKAQLTDFTTRRDQKSQEALRKRKPGGGFARSVAATGNRITKLVRICSHAYSLCTNYLVR